MRHLIRAKHRYALGFSTAAIVGLAISAAPANATLLTYEGFDYTAGQTLQAQLNGGAGWSGGWFGSGPSAVTGSGLNYPSAVTTGGGVATAGNASDVTTAARYFSAPLQEGKTYFLSFLLQPGAGLGDYGGLNLQGDNGSLFMGRSGGQAAYGLESGTNVSLLKTSGINVVQNQAAYLVLKATINAGADEFSLYVNPTDLSVLPSTPDVFIGANEGIDLGASVADLYLNNHGGYAMDEIRLGEQYSDLRLTLGTAAVPEPGAVAIFAGMAVVMGGRLVRKRK